MQKDMKRVFRLLMAAAAIATACNSARPVKSDLRAPAFPLITIDPYTSAWSASDELYGSTITHWTGKDFPLLGILTVDGKDYRFLGKEKPSFHAMTDAEGNEAGFAFLTGWNGRYTFSKPGLLMAKDAGGAWTRPGFKRLDRWMDGQGGFGTRKFNINAKTEWDTEDIWVRRTVRLSGRPAEGARVFLMVSANERGEFYLNGRLVVKTEKCSEKLVELPQEIIGSFMAGENILAAHGSNPAGSAMLDMGLYIQEPFQEKYPETATQTGVDVQARQTRYTFTAGPVDLQLDFTAPFFLEDLNLVSRPVNYISYGVKANDGGRHEVQIRLSAGPEWCLDKPLYERAESETYEKDGLIFIKTGNKVQNILQRKGDNVRINWGYFYLAAEKDGTQAQLGDDFGFTKDISNAPEGKFLLGYDDLYSVQYFGKNLRPWWNADGTGTIEEQFRKACEEYGSLRRRCAREDAKLMKEATEAGGKEYAELCALAYRQSIAAHKLVKSPDGDLLFLSKECFSNGSIGTVDITYPSSPLFLYYNPTLVEGLMNHIYHYSESGKWTKPFAAHDVGTYPLANGQTYGADMPVEESGNMLILTAALCRYGNSHEYARKHWETIKTWTDYLMENGLDPADQLCTDDFAGHFAHNANLSVKAILGIASAGRMADGLGEKELAAKYTAAAREMAGKWEEMADDGDHYRLTFDRPGTWSQKYNLVWDKLLGLDIFPDSIARKEVAWYLGRQNEWGLPLDSRATYTKTDWILWTATMAGNPEDFKALVAPVWKFMNETTDRVPMSDWVFTDKPVHRGFQARSVVGGYFIRLLAGKKSR